MLRKLRISGFGRNDQRVEVLVAFFCVQRYQFDTN